MHRRPSHQADDMGARFGEPSSFNVLISTTGVPKYKIAGSIVRTIVSLSSLPDSASAITIEKRMRANYPHLALKLKIEIVREREATAPDIDEGQQDRC
jgi:hypothetical protein